MDFIYTSALIKAVYDEKKDYLDTFCPLIIDVLDESTFKSSAQISQSISAKYHIEIPYHLTTTICRRAARNGYLQQKDRVSEYRLLPAGREYAESLEQVDDVSRRIGALVSDFAEYVRSNGRELSDDGAAQLLEHYIKSNRTELIEFLSPEIRSREASDEISFNDEKWVVHYLVEAEKNKPDHFVTLKQMIYGAMMSALLFSEGADDIVATQTRPFGQTTLFLDTNIIFSLFGFHTEEINLATQQLFEQLQANGFTIKVFDFTVDEVCGVLGQYGEKQNQLYSGLQIDSIYRVLKQKGWNAVKVDEFIIEIETRLREKGIRIHNSGDVFLNNYVSKNELLRDRIQRYKGNQPLSSTNHDLAAIDKIREIRKNDTRRIEDTKAIFLTSDHGLHRFDVRELGHQENRTIAEVILDSTLASVLWLKHPSIELPLQMIIASHSRDMLIDRHIWEKFYKILSDLRQEGKTTDESITTLFYKKQIETALAVLGPNDIDKVTEEFVLSEIQKSVDRIDKEKAVLVSEKNEVINQLFAEKTAEEKRADDLLAERSKIRSNIRGRVVKKATTAAKLWLCAWVLVAYVIEGLFLTFCVIHASEDFKAVISIVGAGAFLTATPAALKFLFYDEKRDSLIAEMYRTELEQLGLSEE